MDYGRLCPICKQVCGNLHHCDVCKREMGITHMYMRKSAGIPLPVAHFICQDCDGTPIDEFYHGHDTSLQGKGLAMATNTPQDDKLEQAFEAVSNNPDITDEELAQLLGLTRPASARFWKLKAQELINLHNSKNAPAAKEFTPWSLLAGFGSLLKNPFQRDENNGSASAPIRPPSRPASPGSAGAMVNAETYEDDMTEEMPQKNTHFERYRTLIDSFDEDRETFLEKVIRWLLLVLAYALPIVVAYAMGKEIGDAYGGKFDMNDGWSLGTHVVAMAGEFALTMMTFSAASALRKSSTDKSYTPKFISSVVAFLLFAVASGLAQWFIASGHIKTVDLSGHANISGFAALVFRVAMVPGVDVAALLFLAVMNFKSLKKFVADQRIRAQAIRDLNEAELEIERAQSTARRRELEEQQDIEQKEQRNAVWLEMDRMNAQHMIADAQRRALPPPPATIITPDEDTNTGAERSKVRRLQNN